MKKLMLGNEAVARGLYEAGCRVVSSYPGTPSTEMTEYASTYPEIYCEWAPNEKVALEAAIGASIGGARSFAAMKHVGLNVAADPLFTASYTGVNAGLVIGVADDPGMHSSQNEQDSRHYAAASKIPMVEPADSMECKEFVKAAYAISEEFDTPVLLRSATRIAHSQSIVELEERREIPLRDYQKNPEKYVMMPGMARARHVVVEARMDKLRAFAETTALNQIEWGSTEIGVIAAGACYHYAKECLGEGASYFKLGLVHPLPQERIRDFAGKVKRLVVVEELDPVIEDHCRRMGLAVEGKTLFPLLGEFNQSTVKKALLGKETPSLRLKEELPVRPPVMCPGCPHRGMFHILHKLGVMVSGDIGCYTLGAQPPLSAIDTTICMGASISGLHGFNKARGPQSAGNSVAVIGDSTFMHSGITGLVNIVYNQGISTVIIADNSITGMTGHQENPTTGYTIKGDPTAAVDLEKLCYAVGVRRVVTVDPNDQKAFEAAVKEELAAEEPSVIISRRPCALLRRKVTPQPPLHIDQERCRACKACLKIGCPALTLRDGKAHVDATLCVGCGLCRQLCVFDAICRD